MKRRNFVLKAFSLSAGTVLTPAILRAEKRNDQDLTKKNTIITLQVNTASINENNKNQMTNMFDNRGGVSNSGNHANYISLIDIDKSVIWDGQPQVVNGDQVNITKIKKKEITDNKSLLKKDEYSGTTQVEAKVRRNYEPGEEAYDVYFTVIRNGVSTNYVIDPKLKIKT